MLYLHNSILYYYDPIVVTVIAMTSFWQFEQRGRDEQIYAWYYTVFLKKQKHLAWTAIRSKYWIALSSVLNWGSHFSLYI